MAVEIPNYCTIDGQNTPLVELISGRQVLKAVGQLDDTLANKFFASDVLAIGVLNGAVPLMGRLVTGAFSEATNLRYDTVRFKSRTAGVGQATGIVMLKDTVLPIEGQKVVVIEDLVDSGLTLSRYVGSLTAQGAESVTVVSLINKPDAREHHLPEDVEHIYAFDVDARLWVVGFGMDIDEQHRNGTAIRVPESQLLAVPEKQRYSSVL